MMNRNETKKMMRDVLCGNHEMCTNNHYADVEKAMDIILDYFEQENDLLKAEKESLIDKYLTLSVKYSNLVDDYLKLKFSENTDV